MTLDIVASLLKKIDVEEEVESPSPDVLFGSSKKEVGEEDNTDAIIEEILNQDSSKWDPLVDSEKFE